LGRAGQFAGEFHFWLAEAQFQNTNYAAAARKYSQVIRNFTISTHFLNAATGKPWPFQIGATGALIQLLDNPMAPFGMQLKKTSRTKLPCAVSCAQ